MADKQLIISIGREYGSGGHFIAEKLSKRFNLPLYDVNLLTEVASEKSGNIEKIQRYDEHPKKKFTSRTVKGYSNSPELNVANLQFDFLRNKASEGKSFVVVGRCSETILKEYDGLITIFVLGDMEDKITRVSEIYRLSRSDAIKRIERFDKKRKSYHNSHSKIKWGDSRNYELSINSSKLGINGTIDVIEDYIKRRTGEIK